MADAASAGMRRILSSTRAVAAIGVFATTVLSACNDSDRTTNDAVVDGEALGRAKLAQARIEFHGQPDPIVLGKSCAIMLAIDDGIAMQATLALERSSDAGVRGFAQRMLDEHDAHVAQTTDVLAALDVMDLDNPVAASLRAEADASVAELSASTTFDVDYLRSQVTDHSAALVLVVGIDRYLAMPSDTTIRWFDDTESMLREHRADAIELFDARR